MSIEHAIDDPRSAATVCAPSVEISIVVPSWNGHAQLSRTVAELEASLRGGSTTTEIIVVDDHSTPPLVSSLYPRAAVTSLQTTVLENGGVRGKGSAVARGMLAARGRYRVFIDSDLAYRPSELTKIVDALRSGADVAIACRVLPGSTYVTSSASFRYLYRRHALSRAFNLLVRSALLPGLFDTQAGLKGFTAEAADAIFSHRTVNGFGFDLECLYIAQLKSMRIDQVPVVFHYDSEPSTVNLLRDFATMLGDIGRIRRNAARGRYA